MDQNVPVRYVFILHETDSTCKHYTVILIILLYVLCGIILDCLSIYLWHHFTYVFTYFNVNTGMVWLYMDKI